ncbi:hypothetical protein M436DRAFT_78624 [Aureobasidium namibiae CBS 147.97]|uniref:DUF7605 domain-containing protein n=1 Tax=Aureobasidium namibiae CBS 147.97 TaxID=1043004 RepID=A0A074WUN5_9PEZI|nr:uncharacterized protein M436DRAFT_78624 [Aureobasidium namibiae CBS 147.97]KEQ76888.1 hypothetical protein M436DRAFT_78624 [Aureobasidium namibiae CBS 147.97]
MPLTDASRESFMFIKCTARTTVAKIREAFLSREEAPSNILLHLGSGIPSETTKVAELDFFRDKVIVFHARSLDPDDTTSNTRDRSTTDSMLNGIPDGTFSNTMHSPTDSTRSSSTHNGIPNGTSGNTMDSSLNGIPDVMSNKSMYNRTQLRTSLSLWSSNDGSGAKKTDQQKDAEQRLLTLKLKDLEKALEKDVSDTLTEIRETMNENIFENYDTAINAAANAALPTSQGWGAHRSLGGLYWATYKAVVRRQGVFTGKGGLSDFNAQLTEPIYKHLANGWEKAFQRRLPHVLKACAKVFSNDLRAFHKAIQDHSFSHGGNPRLSLLAQQLTNYEAVFSDLGSKMLDLINERQREINREFTPNVCNAMLIVYNICSNEAGPGQFNRMKIHMTNHVEAQKDTMFQRATQVVRNMIMDLTKDFEEHMANRTDQVFVGMRRDYLQVLSNVRVDDITMPKWERSLRNKVEDIIQQSEENFEAILDGREVADPKDEASAGAAKEGDDGTDVENADQDKRKAIKEDASSSEEDTHMEDTHA